MTNAKWALFFLVLPFSSASQVITTFAGGGVSICNNCPATTTSIVDPSGSAFDSNGNCYFASGLGGNRIRRINVLGVVKDIAGDGIGGFSGDGGLAFSSKLKGPESVKLDSHGNLYIADAQNFRIRKINVSDSVISTIGGIGTMGYNGDGIPATTAQFMPSDIYVDKIGNIFIADYNARRVRKIDTLGIIHTIAGKGTVGYSGDGAAATAAEINPLGLTMDNIGNLYISDPYANVVRKINTAGIISTVAGNGNWVYAGDGIPATNAQIQPTHLAIDKINNLYISDNFNKRIFKVNPSGIIYCVAGNGIAAYSGDGGLATAASLDNNIGQLSVDSCGNLYVSETSGRIRKITFNPECWPAGVNDVSKSKANVSIYPNPATESLTITATKKIMSVSICNAVGQEVIAAEGRGSKQEIDVRMLPAGVYFVRVNEVWVGRFLKE